MALTVADTDVLIDFLRDHDPGASWVQEQLEAGRLVTTVITRFELLAGARTRSQREAVDLLLDAVPALPLDTECADRGAEVRRALDEDGAGIGMADSLIAGIVLTSGGTLFTRNARHFERVPGLEVTVVSPPRPG